MSANRFDLDALIGSHWRPDGVRAPILDKFSGDVIGSIPENSAEDVDAAVRAARKAFESDFIEPYQRHEILLRARDLLAADLDAVIQDMISETGFTRADCRNDCTRALQTLAVSAEEAKRITGEIIPIHAAPGQTSQRLAYTVRDPIGVVAAITPFNSPLNTVCHKIAPAFAAGNAVVLKPASYTPLSAERICRIFLQAGVPHGWLNLIYGSGKGAGQALLEHPDVDYYTFTGSTAVGHVIQNTVGLRRTQLELGSISGTIVCADANLDHALDRIVPASFRKAGQVCTSVQRLLVERSIMADFRDELSARINALKVGDPAGENTFVGPMISTGEADRATRWIAQAQEAGASVISAGSRQGNVVSPALLVDVPPACIIMREEAFAPVILLSAFDDVEDAIARVNDSPYGLAAGIFTSNLDTSMRAMRKVRVGAFHVNDASSSRVDLMPYGGVKQSGHGLEGPRYAIRDMTEERLITITPTGGG